MIIDKFIDWTERGLAPNEEPEEDACVALATGFFTVADVRGLVAEIEELRRLVMSWADLEELYWRFDAMHKGYGEWAGTPMSERDAFKRTVQHALVRTRFPTMCHNGGE